MAFPVPPPFVPPTTRPRTPSCPWNVLFAVPCYGGMVHMNFMDSMLALTRVFAAAGIPHTVHCWGNESLVTRVRNYYVAYFLGHPEFTHMMFIDSDIGFDPRSVIRMLERDVPLSVGLYPKKGYAWDDLFKWAREHPDQHVTPDVFMGNAMFVVNVVSEDAQMGKWTISNGFARVDNAGTGFMLIRRDCVLKMCRAYPAGYQNDVEAYGGPYTAGNFHTFFDTLIHPVSQRYLSEDYAFCHRWVAIGGEIWADLSCVLTHTGSQTFSGCFLRKLAYHLPPFVSKSVPMPRSDEKKAVQEENQKVESG